MSPGVEPEKATFRDEEDLSEEDLSEEDLSEEDLSEEDLSEEDLAEEDTRDGAAPDDGAHDEAPREAAAASDEEGPGKDTPAAALGAVRPGLVRFDPAAWTDSVPPRSGDGGAWRLVVRRRLYDHGTMVQSTASLAPLAGSQELRLGPDAMSQLGIEPGDEVRVRTPRGELVVTAAADTGVPGGVALLQFNAAPVQETSASALIDVSVAVVEVDLEKVV